MAASSPSGDHFDRVLVFAHSQSGGNCAGPPASRGSFLNMSHNDTKTA